ncbi:hypothetical protein [Roseomonas indoligenes]|uniref:Uncharacterized protein n=1 Tax=Roseomonas indoligenes TaxID=2820811 RepID=A0A940MRF3_9PROT|nr:hypothetical protein [Pararoseomonas indoligenes]MBP0492663.1 hypothetical protein [Pararoseomonas indoligenes]
MTDAVPSRSVRVRSYRDAVRDVGRTFRLAPGVDIAAAVKRAALAAVPKTEGWTMRVFTVRRTGEGERAAAVLDRLARDAMGGTDFAASVAATLDGSIAVLVVAARDPGRIERVSSAMSGTGR